MEDADMEASLNSMIDPALGDHAQLALQSVTPTRSHTPGSNNAENDVEADDDTPEIARKKRTIVPGSTADYRRREANRLAADRSRARANEKRVALQASSQSLKEENERLRAEIEKIESVSHFPALHGGVGEQEHLDVTTGDDAQDSHSRTILAALMSAGHELNGGEGDDSWMQGMEDMLKDAESSGRLGELAALAAGRNGPIQPEGQDIDAPVEDQPEEEAEEQEGTVDQQSESRQEAEDTPADLPPPKKIQFSAEHAALSADSEIAVHVNAEMERIIRDELAATKAALAMVNKEITRMEQLWEEQRADDPAVRGEERTTCLPDTHFTDDAAMLKGFMEAEQEKISSLESRLPPLREAVTKAKEEKLEDEAKLANSVEGLTAFWEGENEGGKAKIMRMLRGVTGYVGMLLGSQPLLSDLTQNGSGSFSTPAIARRRRGRPPKNPLSGGFDSLDSTSYITPSASLTRAPRTGTKSRLVQRLAEAYQATQQQQQEQLSEPAEESNTTAEQYILSHLHDTSSFADFLPHSTEELNGHIDPNLHSGTAVGADGTVGAGETEDNGEPAVPGVLSRWKKGAPGSCEICGRTETSVWRKLTISGEDLKVCNACGLYHTKFGVIRPPELWGDGKLVKKRRPGTRPSRGGADDSSKKRRRKGEPGSENEGLAGREAEGQDVHDEAQGAVGVGEDRGEVHQLAQVERDQHEETPIGDMGPLGELDPIPGVESEMGNEDMTSGEMREEMARTEDMEGMQGMQGMEGIEVEGFDEGHMASILEMGTG